MEISGIQVLGFVLIIGLFYLVFKIVETNWTMKGTQKSELPDDVENFMFSLEAIPEENPAVDGQEGKEIQLVPLNPEIQEPAAKVNSLVLYTVSANEEELELVKVR
jgi:hypothetical protein